MKEKLKKYWKEKSKLAKFSDLFFIVFVIAMLFPSGRMAIGGMVNKVKAMITQPSIIENSETMSDSDFNWKLKDKSNNTVNLKESQGKVIFINLWATWCPPCIGEMPEIQDLYNTFKDNNQIDFYLITSDSVEKMNKFINNKNYTFPVFKSITNTPTPFKSRSIPTTFVISKSGKIVIRKTGAANWGGDKMIGIIENLIKD